MIWGIIIGLSIAASALTAYALWPLASRRQPHIFYRACVVGLALVVLVGPGLAYRHKQQADTSVDLSAFSLGGEGKDFTWDGPATATGNSPHQGDMSLEAMTARLAAKLATQPDNISGWVLLGRSYAALGNIDKAKNIFGDLTARRPDDVEIKVAYGEMLMTAADGEVTPDVRAVFEAAVAADPSHVRAQYDLALADAQQGNKRAAYDRWLALTKDAPADAPWLPDVLARLRETAAILGIAAPEIDVLPTPLSPK